MSSPHRASSPAGHRPGSHGGVAPRAVVASRGEVQKLEAWQLAFQTKRKDRRYYELVEETINPEFSYRYFLLQDVSGKTRAIQPFFLVDQDVLMGMSARWLAMADKVRQLFPRFLKMRTLMAGCAAGEGHLDAASAAEQHRDAEVLSVHITQLARNEGASLVVLKEFPARYRDVLSCFLARGFTRVPSMPMTRLDLSSYKSFDDYMEKSFNGKKRKDFRRKFQATEQFGPIEMETLSDVSSVIDEIYLLYAQVLERSKMQFEKLTKDFFLEIGRRMPDKVRYFIWRRQGKAIAFALCLVEGDTLYGEYLGLDYSIAIELHLYFYVMRDIISWAIAHGYKSIVSTGLSYAPKRQMRHVLEPLDLYVRHTSPVLNAIFKFALPWMEPARTDRTLRQFPNYGDLWGNSR
jgi:hypothetical protein